MTKLFKNERIINHEGWKHCVGKAIGRFASEPGERSL